MATGRSTSVMAIRGRFRAERATEGRLSWPSASGAPRGSRDLIHTPTRSGRCDEPLSLALVVTAFAMASTRLAIVLSAAGAAALRIRYETADGLRVVDGVRKGELLRTALLRRGVSPHNGNSKLINCRGLGTCGTCAVEISGESVVSPQNAREQLRLGLPPHGPASANRRLACQCIVLGDVGVKKYDGMWGQAPSMLAPASAGTAYFGELEYVLDTASPPPEPCSVCSGTGVVNCPSCGSSGDRPGAAGVRCRACSGSGQVLCRSCFSGDPFDLEAVRKRSMQRPD